ncbi:MAG: helicase DnaB [Cyanobacteriota bacterium]
MAAPARQADQTPETVEPEGTSPAAGSGQQPGLVLALLSLFCLGLGALPAMLPKSPQIQHRIAARTSPSQQVETLPAVGQSELSYFTPEELAVLERHFGVHGSQPALAQLFFEGVGQFRPLRRQTLRLLQEVRPTLLQECARQNVNPMLVAAVLYEEVQLAKPGEHLPVAAHSGLIRTHGPAQISLEELVIQGRLSPEATEAEKYAAVDRLLDPDENVRVLVSKFARLTRKLGFPTDRVPEITAGAADVKALATLAYLYNGKLDYPSRILRHMEDPELHGLIYSQRQDSISALI